MKKVVQLIGIVALMGLFMGNTFGQQNEFKGAHITYSCLGGNQYEVTLDVDFAPCFTLGSLPSSQEYFLKDPCNNTTDTLSTELTNTEEVFRPCESTCSSPCSGPSACNAFQERYTYKDTITVDTTQCCDVKLGYSYSEGRANISGPDDDFYIESEGDFCLKPCHDGVKMDAPVIYELTENEGHTINYGGLPEAGQDNLTFDFDSAYYSPSITYNYGSNFSPNKPFPLSTPGVISHDASSGNLSFIPGSNSSEGPLVRKAEKDDNGQVYSITRREIMFSASQSPNTNPQLSGFDSTASNSTHFCENEDKCLTIYTNHPDGDTVSLDWSTNLPSGADLSVTGGAEPELQLCWEPDADDIPDEPYEIVVSASDDGCLIPGQVQDRYYVDVNAKENPQASVTITQNCNEVSLVGNLSSALKNYDFAWKEEGDTVEQEIFTDRYYPDSGRYAVEFQGVSVDNCDTFSVNDTVIIEYDDLKVDAGEDNEVCSIEEFGVKGSAEDGKLPHAYEWTGGQNTLEFDTMLSRDTSLALLVTDDRGCTKSDTVSYEVATPPEPSVPDEERICGGDNLQVSSGVSDFNHEHRWMRLEDSTVIGNADEVTLSQEGTYEVRVNNTNTVECYGRDTLQLHVNPEVEAVTGNDTTICPGEEVTLWAQGGENYTWKDSDGNEIGTDSAVTVSPESSGLYEVTVYETVGGVECEDVANQLVSVKDLPEVEAPAIEPVCEDTGNIALPEGEPEEGHWSGPAVDAGNLQVDDLEPGEHTLYYEHTDPGAGCNNVDSTVVEILPLPAVDAIDDESVCPDGKPLPLTADVSGVQWSGPGVTEVEADSFVFDPTSVESGQNYMLNYQYQDDQGCSVAGQSEISVLEAPDISMDVDPEEGEAPLEVSFTGSSDQEMFHYEWRVYRANDTIQLGGASVNYTFEDTGLYSVKLIGESEAGCQTTITAEEKILVDEGTNLLEREDENHEWKLYPNPTVEGFYLKGEQGSLSKVSVYSVAGKKVSVHSDISGRKAFIPAKELAPGMYMIRVDLADGKRFYLKGEVRE